MAKVIEKNRKIAVITAIRSDYSIVYPIMREIKRCPDLDLQAIVTGTHLLKRFGRTKRIVEADFKISSFVNIGLKDDTHLTMAKSLGRGIINFAKTFSKLKPDIVVVAGDRVEMLAVAQAAAVLNIPVAHVHAGDVSLGNIDESVRYAMTRFSHILFASTKNSAKRLIQSGEEKWRVFTVGSPQIDTIKLSGLLSKKELSQKFDLQEPYAIAFQHPVTTSPIETTESTRAILQALNEMDIFTVIIYPNSDPGSEDIIKIISQYESKLNFRIYKNLQYKDYLSLLKHALFLIGNTTSGIIEAPVLNIPFLNVGTRQGGRDSANNVIWLKDKRGKTNIKKAIEKVINRKSKFVCRHNPYKAGASKKIAEVLRTIKLDYKLLRKNYHSLLK